MRETTKEFIDNCERLIAQYHDPKPGAMRRIVVAPCQPVNCYEDTMIESARLAREYGCKLHTHLSEGEDGDIQKRTGMRTLDYMEKIGFAGPDLWIAHGYYLTPDQYPQMARLGVGISHCPTTAILTGAPTLELPALAKAGVTVSIGCDGSATNDGSSLLDAIRTGYLMQCQKSKERGGYANAYDILKLATVNGAKTLGADDLGSLEAGKGADLFMVDTRKLELAGALHDPKNLLGHVGVTGPAALTMAAGKIIWQNGKLTGIDNEAELAAQAEDVCSRVLRKAFREVFE
jgi:hydroxyatrazine ethylaminohydrolase